MEQLKNEWLTIEVSEHGAELQSIRRTDDGHEYLWQGDPAYWPRRAPILFPLVGSVWGDKYICEGKEYNLGRHGFARDMDFTLISKSESRLTYLLCSDEETLKLYPYHFHLSVSFRLEERRLKVIWHVFNIDRREISFQIGGHPAFNLPDKDEYTPEKNMADGTLVLDNSDELELLVTGDGGCLSTTRGSLKTDGGQLRFNEDSFANDAIIIDRSQVHRVSILDKEGKAVVTVGFNHPAVGIWSPWGKHAPFVCIEPWFGVSDFAHYSGVFRDRYLMNHLLPGASWMTEFWMEF